MSGDGPSGPQGPEHVDRARVGRLLHRDHVARIDERARDQVEALLGAVDDEDVVDPRLDAEPQEVGGQVRAEGRVAVAARRVLEEGRALGADDLVQHPAERVGREESAIGHALREGDQRPGALGDRDAPFRPRAGDVGAPREQARPVERDPRRGRRGRPVPARRWRGDEGPLPDVRPGEAPGHQLLVGERHGRPVDAERPGQLPRRRQLHAGREPPLTDQALDLRLDLAGERDRPFPVELQAERHASHFGTTIVAVNRQLDSTDRSNPALSVTFRQSSHVSRSYWSIGRGGRIQRRRPVALPAPARVATTPRVGLSSSLVGNVAGPIGA
jgi:hypothetical protein